MLVSLPISWVRAHGSRSRTGRRTGSSSHPYPSDTDRQTDRCPAQFSRLASRCQPRRHRQTACYSRTALAPRSWHPVAHRRDGHLDRPGHAAPVGPRTHPQRRRAGRRRADPWKLVGSPRQPRDLRRARGAERVAGRRPPAAGQRQGDARPPAALAGPRPRRRPARRPGSWRPCTRSTPRREHIASTSNRSRPGSRTTCCAAPRCCPRATRGRSCRRASGRSHRRRAPAGEQVERRGAATGSGRRRSTGRAP